MATLGIDYGKMTALISFVETTKSRMDTLLSDLSTEAPTALAAVYGGEAADQTKARLQSIATSVATEMTELVANLKSKADEMQSAYEAQEKKMQNSVS